MEIPGALKDADRIKLIKWGFKFPNQHNVLINANLPKNWTCTVKDFSDSGGCTKEYYFYNGQKKA